MSAELDLLKKELALMKYRVMAAEHALYAVAENMRTQAQHGDALIAKIHQLNVSHPLGDSTADGVQSITLQAIKASVPGAAGLSDDEVISRYLSPIEPPKETPWPK